VVQRFEYSPFGRTTFLSPAFVPVTPTEDWTFLFHGEFRDGDTGYYNYGFRFYNDTTGRWPSRDPIGMRGGLNLYDFVRNSSTRKIDILGLDGGLPGGWSAAIERLGDWITGDHDPSTVYGPDTLESRELSGSATVAKLRKFFREKNQYACPAGVTNYKEEFRPWKANFEQDLDNGTVHFVGSFSAEISLLSVMKMDTFAGSDGFIYTRFLMTVRYKLTNTVSIESLFRFLDGGTRLIVDDSWNIEDNTRNEFIPGDGGTGGSYLSMFSNWHQTFWWVEHDTCLRKHKMSSCTASYKDHEQPVKPYDVNDIIKP
jgi:RHS repeat-associated protein